MWRNTSYERARNAAREGQPVWALWQYEPSEWNRFISRDQARVLREQKNWLLVVLLFGGLMGILWSVTAVATNGPGALICGLVPLIWFGGIGGVSWLLTVNTKTQWYGKLKSGPREVIIGPMQARIGGNQVDLVSPGIALTRAWVSPTDLSIVRFRTENTFGRGHVNEIWLPVPAGHEREAEQLAERFRKEIVRPAGLELS